MASGTLHHFSFALFHLEYFDMAVSAFKVMLVDVGVMTKNYRPRAPEGWKLDIAPTDLLLLSTGYAYGKKE